VIVIVPFGSGACGRIRAERKGACGLELGLREREKKRERKDDDTKK
jgi:hypothetical protein